MIWKELFDDNPDSMGIHKAKCQFPVRIKSQSLIAAGLKGKVLAGYSDYRQDIIYILVALDEEDKEFGFDEVWVRIEDVELLNVRA